MIYQPLVISVCGVPFMKALGAQHPVAAKAGTGV